MKITNKNLKRIIREEKIKLLKESVHSRLDAELTNVVYEAAQMVAEQYAEITVQDVESTIRDILTDEYLAGLVEPRLSAYFVESVRAMTYEDVVDRMQELVQLGELTDGYEDFFYMNESYISEKVKVVPHGDLGGLVEDTLEYISNGSFSNGMQIVQYVRDAGRDYGLSASDQDKAIARIINGMMAGPRF
tara:strand:+ start:389 stop:958 length:570 start_codon:yes stop_codon:yes gene_type:complete